MALYRYIVFMFFCFGLDSKQCSLAYSKAQSNWSNFFKKETNILEILILLKKFLLLD